MEPHLPMDGRISRVKVLARRHVAAVGGLSVPNLPSSRFESAQSAFCRSDQPSFVDGPPPPHMGCSPQNPMAFGNERSADSLSLPSAPPTVRLSQHPDLADV